MVGVNLNTHQSHLTFIREFKQLQKEYENLPSLFDQISCGTFSPDEDKPEQTKLYNRLITWAFSYKNSHPDFQLPGLANRAHHAAMRIIHHDDSSKDVLSKYLFDNPDVVSFLTNKQHFFHKHVDLLSRMSHQGDVKLHFNNGNLTFHTGERVKDLMNEAQADPKKVLYLDAFKIHRFSVDQLCSPQGLQPNFRAEKDGKYYVVICTSNINDTPTSRAQHSFLRLINGVKGETSSIGSYPMKKPSCNNIYINEKGRFENADSYEWIDPSKISEFKIPLTEEEFNKLHSHISDQIRDSFTPEGISYALHKANCSDWAMDKVDPFLKLDWSETRMEFIFTLFPSFYKRCRLMAEKFPKTYRYAMQPLLTIGSLAMHVFRLAFTYCIGVRKNNHKSNPKAKSVIDDEGHLSIDISKISHPYLLKRLLMKHIVPGASKGKSHIINRPLV